MVQGSFVLIHGMNDAPSGLERLRRGLAAHGPTFVPAWQGHGGRPIEQDYSFDTIALDIAAQIEERSTAPCHVVGHSIGGMVGRRLSELRPDLVATLTEIATPHRADWFTVSLISHLLDIKRLSDPKASRSDALSDLHHPQDWQRVARANTKLIRDTGSVLWKRRIDASCPTLLISGSDDVFGDPRGCLARAKVTQDIRVMLARGTLHPFPSHLYDAVVKAILRLRDGHFPPSGPRLTGSGDDDCWITSRDLIARSALIHTMVVRTRKLLKRALRFHR